MGKSSKEDLQAIVFAVWDLFRLLTTEVFLIVDAEFGSLSHNKGLHSSKVGADSLFEVLVIDTNFEVMVILPRVDLESWLISLESYSVSYSGTEHHLRTIHKVPHAVLK